MLPAVTIQPRDSIRPRIPPEPSLGTYRRPKTGSRRPRLFPSTFAPPGFNLQRPLSRPASHARVAPSRAHAPPLGPSNSRLLFAVSVDPPAARPVARPVAPMHFAPASRPAKRGANIHPSAAARQYADRPATCARARHCPTHIARRQWTTCPGARHPLRGSLGLTARRPHRQRVSLA